MEPSKRGLGLIKGSLKNQERVCFLSAPHHVRIRGPDVILSGYKMCTRCQQSGTFLVVQWLGLCVSTAGGKCSIPSWGKLGT